MILICNIYPRKFESFQPPRSGLLLLRTKFIYLIDIKTLFFTIQKLKLSAVNSQAPELYRDPRARCARSGENGEGGIISL